MKLKFKEKIKINKNLLVGLVGFVVFIGVVLFYSIYKEKTVPPLSSEDNNSISVWNAETASFKEYKSYEDMEQEKDRERKQTLEEYDKAIKGTIVEQVQNIIIPSYLDEKKLAQLKSGDIEVRDSKSDDFPDGLFLWSASLQKSVNSFAVGDFNKDGLDDVVHIIGYTGGGSGYFYNLIIFINDKGTLKYLAQKELGDRVIIKNVKYNSEEFVVDMITQGEGDNFNGYCCLNVPVTIKFKLRNNKLYVISKI